MTALASYLLKLFRASEHYDLIAEEQTALVQNDLQSAEQTEVHGGQEWTVVHWADVRDLNPHLGVWLGDFTHNVRSALDHLIYALVTDNGEDPGEHTQFPIYDSETLWKRAIEDREPGTKPSPVHGVPAHELAVIKAAQPYHLSHKKRARHPLMKLLRISNVDKHQTLHAASVSVSAPDFIRFEPAGFYAISRKKIAKPGVVLEEGAEIVRVQRRLIAVPPPDTKVYVRVRGSAEIVFSEQGKPPIATVDDLRLIHETARHIVADLRPNPHLLATLQEI